MALVVLIGLDFAVGKHFWDINQSEQLVYALPMFNVLFLTSLCLKRTKEPFWIGFHTVGWVMTAVFGFLAWNEVPWFLGPADGFFGVLDLIGRRDVGHGPIGLSCIAVVYTTPLVLLSLLGGWIAARRVGRPARSS